MTASMSVTLVNDRSEVERLSRLVDAFGEAEGLQPDAIFSVNLALDEVVTNIIRYAHDDDGRQHPIVVRLTLEPGVLTAEVEDDGRAFNPLEAPAPDLHASIEERPIGGLGIHLVRSVMSSVEYRREDGRNVLTMKKEIVSRGSALVKRRILQPIVHDPDVPVVFARHRRASQCRLRLCRDR